MYEAINNLFPTKNYPKYINIYLHRVYDGHISIKNFNKLLKSLHTYFLKTKKVKNLTLIVRKYFSKMVLIAFFKRNCRNIML